MSFTVAREIDPKAKRRCGVIWSLKAVRGALVEASESIGSGLRPSKLLIIDAPGASSIPSEFASAGKLRTA